MRTSYSTMIVLVSSVLSACGSEAAQGDNPPTPMAGFVRLLAEDPLRHTYDFLRADYGAVIQDGEVKNAGSHLDFGGYHADELTVGIQGGEVGAIVDLGTDDDIAAALGIEQTVGGGQGFSHLDLGGDGFNISSADVVLSAPETWVEDVDHATVVLNHVYVARVVGGEGLDMIVKLLVVEAQTSTVTSLEWIRLR